MSKVPCTIISIKIVGDRMSDFLKIPITANFEDYKQIIQEECFKLKLPLWDIQFSSFGFDDDSKIRDENGVIEFLKVKKSLIDHTYGQKESTCVKR